MTGISMNDSPKPIVSNPDISSCSDTNPVDMSNIWVWDLLFSQWIHNRSGNFPMITADSIATAINISQIIECSSPSPVTFGNLFRLFRTWSFTKFTNALESTDNSHSASSFPMTKLLRPCLSLRINIGSLRSFTEYHLIHQGLRGSIMMNFLVKETTLGFSCRSQKVTLGLPIVRTSVSAFHMWRPNMVFVTLWVACWKKKKKKLSINCSL